MGTCPANLQSEDNRGRKQTSIGILVYFPARGRALKAGQERLLTCLRSRFDQRGRALYLRIMETVHFGRAPYYPHIFPQSRLWLRTAALYHDQISRIVPAGFVPSECDRHGGPELLNDFEALQDAGFIEDKHPDHQAEVVAFAIILFAVGTQKAGD